MENQQDMEKIRMIVETAGQRYVAKGGSVRFAGIENGRTVVIAPDGFCWR